MAHTTSRITSPMLNGLRLMLATEHLHGRQCWRPASVAKATVKNLIQHGLLEEAGLKDGDPSYFITESGYLAIKSLPKVY